MDEQSEGQPTAPATAQAPAEPPEPADHAAKRGFHEVVFVTYPKLLFTWPLILLGLVFYPLGAPPRPAEPGSAGSVAAVPATAETPASAPAAAERVVSGRLEVLGWIYIWVAVLVLLTLGVDVDRNMAIFWIVLFGLVWVLGLWLRDVKGFTFFGDIYAWFADRDVQYDRQLGLVLSLLLLVPYVLMLGWARINDRWRITHNEFEHYAFGKMDDSLGRGAKTIRTVFPDVFELLLGAAGTLIVFNATGTQELRRIPHVMFLPMVRKRLNKILETTAITTAQMEEEEDDREQ